MVIQRAYHKSHYELLDRSFSEPLIPPLLKPLVRHELFPSRQDDPLPVKFLDAVLEHEPVMLLQHIFSHLDDIPGAHPDNEVIERGMMQLAQRNAVVHTLLALGLGVRNNVCRIQQLLITCGLQKISVAIIRAFIVPQVLFFIMFPFWDHLS